MKRASSPSSVSWLRLAMLLPVLPFLVAFEPLKSSNKDIERGNEQMKAGKAEEALTAYDKAVAKLPNDPAAHFDRGTALFALSRFDEAGQEFLRATEAKDGALKASAFYNLGNAFFKKDKFKEAVEAYKRVLALDPREARAKWNLEIALKRQKEEQKKKDDKDKQDKDKNKDKQDDKDKNKDDKKDQDKKDKDKQDDKKQDKDKDKQDDKKQDKDKDKQDDKKQDKDKDKQDDKKDEPKPPPQEKPPEPKSADEQEIGAVLDSLERNPKDLEKERARLRAVRRRPPVKDW
jgi:Ca-activated chloride channel family protein